MKKYYLIILMFIIMLLLKPTIYNVNVSSDFLLWQNKNNNLSSAKKIDLYGYFYDYSYKKDEFKGTIEFLNYENKKEKLQIYIPFNSIFGNNIAHVYEINQTKLRPINNLLFSYNNNFKNINFYFTQPFEDTEVVWWDFSNSYVLSYPLTTRRETIEKNNEIWKNSKYKLVWS